MEEDGEDRGCGVSKDGSRQKGGEEEKVGRSVVGMKYRDCGEENIWWESWADKPVG